MNLNNFINGFNKLGSMLSIISESEDDVYRSIEGQYINQMTQYIKDNGEGLTKTEVNIIHEILEFREIPNGNISNVVKKIYTVPLIKDEYGFVKSFIRILPINIKSGNQENLLNSVTTYTINNKDYYDTPLVATSISMFVPDDLVYLTCELTDDNIERFREFINQCMIAICKLLTNGKEFNYNPNLSNKELKFTTIMTNVFAKKLLCGSNVIKFDKYPEESQKLFEILYGMDKACKFNMIKNSEELRVVIDTITDIMEEEEYVSYI